MFLQNKIFLPADFNFSCGATKISNHQGLVGVFLPARLFSSPLPFPSSFPSAQNRSQPLTATRSFLYIFLALFRHLPPKTPLESPEIKDFREFSLFSFRGEREAGSLFREIFLGFQEPFGEVSQTASIEKIWEDEGKREWKGGRGRKN